jgi:hypothetical protein
MFPERRLVHEGLSASNRIVVIDTGIIIVAKVFWIGETIVTDFAGFPESRPIV